MQNGKETAKITTYTNMVERWITDSKREYIRDTRRLKKSSEIIKENKEYEKYTSQFIEQLEALRQHYCSRNLGFSMICHLHKKYPSEVDDENRFTVLERKVHACNVEKPTSVDKGDLPVYIEIFTEIVCQAKKVKIPETVNTEYLHILFSSIFWENKYIKNTKAKTKKDITRDHIAELCFMLGWNSSDCDALLLRMDDDGLCANCMDDQIYRYVLDAPNAKWTDINAINKIINTHHNYTQSQANTVVPMPAQTRVVYKTLGKIIVDQQLSSRERLARYAEELYFRKDVYQRVSKTSRTLLEHILLYTAYTLGWRSTLMEGNLPAKILSCTVRPLTEKEQERLIKAICSGYSDTDSDLFEGPIEFKQTYTVELLAYPEIGKDGALHKKIIHDQFLSALRGKQVVTKSHILYALFLLKISKNRDASYHTGEENPVHAYNKFVELANAVLKYAFLPEFYPAHTLEFSIGKAILTSNRVEEAFSDVTNTFSLLEKAKKEEKEQEQWEDPIEKRLTQKEIPSSFQGKLIPQLERMLETVSINELENVKASIEYTSIYDDLIQLAKKAYSIWEKLEFASVDIVFDPTQKTVYMNPTFYGSRKEKWDDRYYASYSPVLISDKISDGLFQLLYERDQGNDWFKKFLIPEASTMISLFSLASRYGGFNGKTLADFLEKEDDWNRRYRRHAILRLMAGMVMDQYGYAEISDRAALKKNAYTKNIAKGELQNSAADFTGDPVETEDTFVMPMIQVKGDCIIKLDSMDKQDVEKILRWRAISKERQNAIGKENIDLVAESPGEIEENVSNKEEPISTSEEIVSYSKTDLDQTTTELDKVPDDIEKIQDDSLKMYFQEIRKYPRLTEEEEKELGMRVARGDPDAKDRMIQANLRLVVSRAKIFTGNGVDFLDLIQAGNEGLIEKAVPNFDVTKGKFSTYAVNWIDEYIRQEINRSRKIRIPAEYSLLLGQAKRYREAYYKDYGKYPSENQIIEHIANQPERLKRFKDTYFKKHDQYPTSEVIETYIEKLIEKVRYALALNVKIGSLDKAISMDDDRDYLSTIEDDTADLEETVRQRTVRSALYQQTLSLSPRESDIIRLRYGLTDDSVQRFFTRKEIAQALGVSMEAVIRAEINFKRKLRHPDNAAIFEDFL